MFWLFLMFAALGLVFAKLGALSVWVVVFRFGLALALLALTLVGLVFLWRRVLARRRRGVIAVRDMHR